MMTENYAILRTKSKESRFKIHEGSTDCCDLSGRGIRLAFPERGGTRLAAAFERMGLRAEILPYTVHEEAWPATAGSWCLSVSSQSG